MSNVRIRICCCRIRIRIHIRIRIRRHCIHRPISSVSSLHRPDKRSDTEFEQSGYEKTDSEKPTEVLMSVSLCNTGNKDLEEALSEDRIHPKPHDDHDGGCCGDNWNSRSRSHVVSRIRMIIIKAPPPPPHREQQ
mmetsp:Transcript_40749/g.57301  ORF Transcript_40749/g.57301 Transcript_40749/m.57301 type:complete len:135 (-) Transcript_40749:412-816(-)